MTVKWPNVQMTFSEYSDLKKRQEFINTVLSMPEFQAMIAKINALGEEIKELKEKCKQLKKE